MLPNRGTRVLLLISLAGVLLALAYPVLRNSTWASCIAYAAGGFREVAAERTSRFLGKVSDEDTARCRGGEAAVGWRKTPWLDWQMYRGIVGRPSGPLDGWLGPLAGAARGLRGALLDFEYQRIEMLKFNLFDNSGTFESSVRQGDGAGSQRVWSEFRLPPDHALYQQLGASGEQRCSGEIIRFRTIDGICNDVANPLMGATRQPFARNADFHATFPEMGLDAVSVNRHQRRIALTKPDPQVISRKLFTRVQSRPDLCNGGMGLPDQSPAARCDYQKAPHLNVLAGFWIQFMIHDWFSHLSEGANGPELMSMGCAQAPNGNADGAHDKAPGCRPGDRIDKALFAEQEAPTSFTANGKNYLRRAPKVTANYVTAWWDASQIYGYDTRSRRRVKRDPRDGAKLLLLEPGRTAASKSPGYLPILEAADYANPQWHGQESVAFPDNWNVGLSFFHNVFAREHNLFVDHFRALARRAPDQDSGLRHPLRPDQIIRYKDVSDDELFEIARLVIAAEIAKIHTIEWTTQLLYNEPVYLAMLANWSGLLQDYPLVSAALRHVLQRPGTAGGHPDWFAAFAAGPGIIGLGSDGPDINGGVNHFGSPFNFPEEFINAYRLHAMLPDLLEYRDRKAGWQRIVKKIPVAGTLGGKATAALRERGMGNWAVSMGRQRLARLSLQNHPLFLQNLEIMRLQTPTGKIDALALDILRDRERGMPRYNEYRRQYGLKQLTSFDDFMDPRLPENSQEREQQRATVATLREIYGQHRCDESKVITSAQKTASGESIDDCLGHPDGTVVDNIEDVDALVGWLAEFVRPHGFAISETQFQVFILNASRRLFSDRFFTSSFRPEFYSRFGIEWIRHNGPDGAIMEELPSNGHRMEVSPLKRVLQRTIPEIAGELDGVVNAFDPWARDRGEYYSLEWKPRPGAEADVSFAER
jgi:hypothetical protein